MLGATRAWRNGESASGSGGGRGSAAGPDRCLAYPLGARSAARAASVTTCTRTQCVTTRGASRRRETRRGAPAPAHPPRRRGVDPSQEGASHRDSKGRARRVPRLGLARLAAEAVCARSGGGEQSPPPRLGRVSADPARGDGRLVSITARYATLAPSEGVAETSGPPGETMHASHARLAATGTPPCGNWRRHGKRREARGTRKARSSRRLIQLLASGDQYVSHTY